LLQFLRISADDLSERWRARGSQRAIGFVFALLAEALLILAVLSLGWTRDEPKQPDRNLVSVSLEASEQKAPAKAKAAKVQPKADPAQAQAAPPPSQAQQPDQSPPAAATPHPIPRDQMAGFDISKLPRQPAPAPAAGKGMMGPPNLGVPGDSKRVGTAPGGQPMYAAAWYREPYDDELRGYLSTAQGPGWALIACRTAPNFRVENCVGLDEYPDGSNLQRAVLAAAWQFQVRPPRIGGVSQVGAWVRIRIDYTQRRN
jgi:periplasmic protein TonB